MTYTPGPAQYSGQSTTNRVPQGQSVGKSQVIYTANNGTALYTLNSAATTNAQSVKASQGTLMSIQVNNASAGARWLRIYNKATAPTVGTDVPIVVIQLPGSQSKEISFTDAGLNFSAGISISITGAPAVLDATAIAANDVQLALSYV